MKILLAVSGGIDSMCMADMFSHSGEEYAVAHCNFHLRGEDSNADAELVRKWADSHGVRFFCADFDTSGYAEAKGISIEMAAREQRYAWFSFIAEVQGFDAVATAHNANDNAETLILNLLRGTGSRGLRGMAGSSRLSWCSTQQTRAGFTGTNPPPCTPQGDSALRGVNLRGSGPSLAMGGAERSEAVCRVLTSGQPVIELIRPLLGMSRADIEKYAQEHGVQYREDRTNSETVYKRNRIRNVIFPEFEKINPSFIRTLNEDMDRFKQVDDIAEDYFAGNVGKVFDGTGIRISALLAFKHWKYMLYRIIEPYGFNTAVLQDIIRFLEGIGEGKELTISGKRFRSGDHILETSDDRIVLLPLGSGGNHCEEIVVSAAGTYRFGGQTIAVEGLDYTEGMPLKPEAGTLLCDADALGYPFTLRHWRAGDWMRPFGMGGRSKKVSDIFTDLKMSLSEKESAVIIHSPTLSDDDVTHIAAIAGTRMDEALRVTKGSKHIIKISIL